jgi:hypothetical protein
MIDLALKLSLIIIHLNLEIGCDLDQKPIGMEVWDGCGLDNQIDDMKNSNM